MVSPQGREIQHGTHCDQRALGRDRPRSAGEGEVGCEGCFCKRWGKRVIVSFVHSTIDADVHPGKHKPFVGIKNPTWNFWKIMRSMSNTFPTSEAYNSTTRLAKLPGPRKNLRRLSVTFFSLDLLQRDNALRDACLTVCVQKPLTGRITVLRVPWSKSFLRLFPPFLCLIMIVRK